MVSNASRRESMNPDQSEIETIEERMRSATKKLNAMAPALGLAKQVVEYDSDRRKMILARVMAPLIRTGETAVAAEAIGRSDEIYLQALDNLATQYKDAQTVIATFRATEASFEAARSLLSMQKESFKVMQ